MTKEDKVKAMKRSRPDGNDSESEAEIIFENDTQDINYYSPLDNIDELLYCKEALLKIEKTNPKLSEEVFAESSTQ